MHHIFETNPDAILVSALARYEGQEGFENAFHDTGYSQVGSYYNPVYLHQCCKCSDEVHRRDVINPLQRSA